jgi:peptidoglycan/xylan/chitin deacetylase (PgdA/CDA1 family)
LVKNARRRRYTLATPVPLTIDMEREGLALGIQKVISHFKRPDNVDPDGFLSALEEASGAPPPPEMGRRFLDWDEALAMVRGGMSVGSHTLSHRILSSLPPEEQRRELAGSRDVLHQRLGVAVDSLAYPVGEPSSFSGLTRQFAREAGYRAAFSFFGGVNRRGKVDPWNVARIAVGGGSLRRFRLQNAVCRATGHYWP